MDEQAKRDWTERCAEMLRSGADVHEVEESLRQLGFTPLEASQLILDARGPGVRFRTTAPPSKPERMTLPDRVSDSLPEITAGRVGFILWIASLPLMWLTLEPWARSEAGDEWIAYAFMGVFGAQAVVLIVGGLLGVAVHWVTGERRGTVELTMGAFSFLLGTAGYIVFVLTL